ncbi:DUF362 domain-containing protein (plasmid) [Haloferacaceae archaeon DSL9]
MQREQRPTVSAVPQKRVLEVCGEVEFPRVGVIEQRWETDPIPIGEIETRAAAAVDSLDLTDVPDGGSVAVGAGSRGINHIPKIVRGVVAELQDRGYEPFVFPAMGSHGGATPAGQRDKLAALGVTEETSGCPIRATMDVVELGETPDRGVSVFFDAVAAAADAIVPINRVKPHTDFEGTVESGLSKMLVIGMGKQRGAQTAHKWARDWSFRNMIPEITEQILSTLPVAGGVAIVEDQRDDTAVIEGVPPSGFLKREAELLEIAYEILPTLPFESIDVLILDRMGKDISGPGMDPNVIARRPYAPNEADIDTPVIERIYTRSLTDPSHGNATGVGLADVVHADLLAGMNPSKTFTNALTASTLRSIRVPPAVETDRAGVSACLSSIGVVGDAPERVRLVRARDTMHLERLVVSEALIEEARERDDLRVVVEPEAFSFVGDTLPSFP